MGGRRELRRRSAPAGSNDRSEGEGALLSVEVGSVGPDGAGRGWALEARVQLPGVLPGERVAASVVHVRRDGLHFAKLENVERSSPDRVSSPCPHFLRCGGCDFLHATIEWQRQWKRARVASALGRPIGTVSATVSSPDTFGYRHLVKLVRGPEALLGSYAPRSHDVVDMTGCPVHAPTAERIAAAVRAELAAVPSTSFRYLLIRQSASDDRAVVTVVVRTPEREGIARMIDLLAGRAEVGQVRLHINDSPGDALLTGVADEVKYDDGRPVAERLGPVTQHLASGAFAQVNPKAATVLYQRVVDGLEPDGQPVLDLYAGSGGIALTLLAAGASEVVAVESHPSASAAARVSAEAHGFATRLHVVADTVERALVTLPEVDRIVVNPPRKGLSRQVVSALAARRWRRLVYVSCDPDTLARDVEGLGGRIASVVPVDLFPHTRHVETVLTLLREANCPG